MKLWELLSEENKEKLSRVYEQLTGKKLIPPKKDIQIESLKELEKIMKDKPNTTRRR